MNALNTISILLCKKFSQPLSLHNVYNLISVQSSSSTYSDLLLASNKKLQIAHFIVLFTARRQVSPDSR